MKKIFLLLLVIFNFTHADILPSKIMYGLVAAIGTIAGTAAVAGTAAGATGEIEAGALVYPALVYPALGVFAGAVVLEAVGELEKIEEAPARIGVVAV